MELSMKATTAILSVVIAIVIVLMLSPVINGDTTTLKDALGLPTEGVHVQVFLTAALAAFIGWMSGVFSEKKSD